MEEEKKIEEAGTLEAGAQQEQMSYEDLNQNYIDLNIGYQKLLAQYRKLNEEHARALDALQARDFDYMSFFLSSLFKVMEHPKMYNEEFVKWASGNIQSVLVGFSESLNESSDASKKKDEAGASQQEKTLS